MNDNEPAVIGASELEPKAARRGGVWPGKEARPPVGIYDCGIYGAGKSLPPSALMQRLARRKEDEGARP